MNWDLPTQIIVNDAVYHITRKCDYRVVLDVIEILNDEELGDADKVICCLLTFYEELTRDNIRFCDCLNELKDEMFKIINYGEEEEQAPMRPQVMDWAHDFTVIAPAISRVIGYDVRTPDKYTHWFSFLGGYMEIGECTFSTIVSIRSKRSKGQKLDKWEMDYIREHRKQIDLPQKMTKEEREWLSAPW